MQSLTDNSVITYDEFRDTTETVSINSDNQAIKFIYMSLEPYKIYLNQSINYLVIEEKK